jgi:sortase A
MRLKNLILIVVALTTVVALAACGSPGQPTGDQGNQEEAQQENAQQETPDEQGAPKQGAPNEAAPKQSAQESDARVAAVEPPKNTKMTLTVPKMEQLKNDEIPTGLGTDETLFHDYAGVHIKYTGFPWQKGANVYIAGHRIGFPGTPSDKAFWDLNELEEGDEFYITDSEGRKYTYEVFSKFIAGPDNLSVLDPVEGKSIMTLQTCTLPDYTNRLLVRGELKEIEGA